MWVWIRKGSKHGLFGFGKDSWFDYLGPVLHFYVARGAKNLIYPISIQAHLCCLVPGKAALPYPCASGTQLAHS